MFASYSQIPETLFKGIAKGFKAVVGGVRVVENSNDFEEAIKEFNKIEKAIREAAPLPRDLRYVQGNLALEHCKFLLGLIQKERYANEASWNASKKYYSNKRSEKCDYAETDSRTYWRLIDSINTQENQAEQKYYETNINLCEIESFICGIKAQIRLNLKKRELNTYLTNQIDRIKKKSPNCEKVRELESVQKNLPEATNDNFNMLLSKVRNEVKRHRERGFFGMVIKFNWFRNTESYNQLNKIFEENNKCIKLRK